MSEIALTWSLCRDLEKSEARDAHDSWCLEVDNGRVVTRRKQLTSALHVIDLRDIDQFVADLQAIAKVARGG